MTTQSSYLVAWAEFNRIKWGCKPLLLRFIDPGSEAYCESLLFLNKGGELYLPPLNQYHTTEFRPTPTNKRFRINSQWHKVAGVMADELVKVGGSQSLVLPPNITDVRPFQWRGFRIDVKYTYRMKLPYSIQDIDGNIRTRIKKAHNQGYRCVLTTNMEDAYTSLIATEKRQGFNHQLTVADLELARSLLGDQIFRCYVCYSPQGEPVSTNISIRVNDRQAIGWVAGSNTNHLGNGIVQLLQDYEFTDLNAQGISDFDLCGANIATVAESKSAWGGELIPYYAIRIPGYKEVFRAGRQWLTFNKQIVSH